MYLVHLTFSLWISYIVCICILHSEEHTYDLTLRNNILCCQLLLLSIRIISYYGVQ